MRVYYISLDINNVDACMYCTELGAGWSLSSALAAFLQVPLPALARWRSLQISVVVLCNDAPSASMLAVRAQYAAAAPFPRLVAHRRILHLS